MDFEATNMIIQFFDKYGLKLALVACIGIFLLGILKFFHVFDKIEKGKRKYVYAGISGGFSIIASAIYLAVSGGFEWASFGVLAVSILVLNHSMYALYENYGVRAVLRKLGNLLLDFIVKCAQGKTKNDTIATVPATTETVTEDAEQESTELE